MVIKEDIIEYLGGKNQRVSLPVPGGSQEKRKKKIGQLADVLNLLTVNWAPHLQTGRKCPWVGGQDGEKLRHSIKMGLWGILRGNSGELISLKLMVGGEIDKWPHDRQPLCLAKVTRIYSQSKGKPLVSLKKEATRLLFWNIASAILCKMVWKQDNYRLWGYFSRLGQTWVRPELKSNGNGEDTVDSKYLRIWNL